MPSSNSQSDSHWMAIALEEAAMGRGYVEPNPMVGCVLVRDGKELARGHHAKFGEDHAEAAALKNCAANGNDAAGSTAYVTLEPCCHQGKTPPCADALIAAKVARVVIAGGDPFPQVDGGGLKKLRDAGIEVHVGVMQTEARMLNAPYLKRVTTGKPWVIAKWAMTLDGKIATATGESQWISGEESRQVVHKLRSRADAVIVGSGTSLADDPKLDTRLPDGRSPARVATRVVVDSRLQTQLDSKLVSTAKVSDVLLAVSDTVDAKLAAEFESRGCQVLRSSGSDHSQRLSELLDHLGKSGMTNVLVEGGGGLLGGLLQLGQIDEVHIFIGNRIVGGVAAASPVAGPGIENLADGLQLTEMVSRTLGEDTYLTGIVKK